MHTAMGTRYHIEDPDDLFLSFALINGKTRQPYDEFVRRTGLAGIRRAALISDGPPVSIADTMAALGEAGFHGALDGVEGAVWVHENGGEFRGIAKFVKADKVDGRYISSVTGAGDLVNYFGPDF
jgi:hypothetical protein